MYQDIVRYRHLLFLRPEFANISQHPVTVQYTLCLYYHYRLKSVSSDVIHGYLMSIRWFLQTTAILSLLWIKVT